MKQVLLVPHGPTIATESAGFPADEALEPAGIAEAANLAAALFSGHRALCSPAIRARQTAAAAGLRAETELRLAECDLGTWAGRRLADLYTADPEATTEWMTDPEARPHDVVIKASVVHALRAELSAFWRIEVQPLSITELCAHDECWSVVRTNWMASG